MYKVCRRDFFYFKGGLTVEGEEHTVIGLRDDE